MNFEIPRDAEEFGLDTVISRWDDDGSGGVCPNCNRYFGCDNALEDHQVFCRNLLMRKNKAAEKTGVFEEVDDEDEYWLDGLVIEDSAWSYAETCLSYLNQEYPHRDYNLVKPGCYSTVDGTTGPVVHLNFKAKPNDGPVETFFAQLRLCWPCDGERQVDYCLSLGASESLPPSGSECYGNCNYCPTAVRHPGVECEKFDMEYVPADYAAPPSSSYEYGY